MFQPNDEVIVEPTDDLLNHHNRHVRDYYQLLSDSKGYIVKKSDTYVVDHLYIVSFTRMWRDFTEKYIGRHNIKSYDDELQEVIFEKPWEIAIPESSLNLISKAKVEENLTIPVDELGLWE